MVELPNKGEYFYCYSRGSVLLCVNVRIEISDWSDGNYQFEYVTTSARPWARDGDGKPQEVGGLEWISYSHLTPLTRITEMEVLAYAAREPADG